MAALWIDLWNKRCGIALEVHNISIPKEIVLRHTIIKTIKKYIENYNITTIVVGLPYDLYNKELTQLEKTQKFIAKLEVLFPHITIVWVDERFSTFIASEVTHTHWKTQEETKRDDISAQIILESYLNKK